MSEIKNFKDLLAWQKARDLVLQIYKATSIFPDEEKFGLTSQIRRSSISVSSNIAEGFGRGTAKDKIQFYGIARGSITEVENQLLIAKDLGYLKEDDFLKTYDMVYQVAKYISGLIKSAPNRKF